MPNRKPTLAEFVAPPPDGCPLCKRPNYHPSDHHLVPKCRGGKETTTVCRDCHRTIHAFFSNKELEREYNSVESLMAHEGFSRAIRFIGKQDGRVHIKASKSHRKHGRNG